MSKQPTEVDARSGREELRLYRAPWKGEVIFACRKCQRRIKKRGGPAVLGKIKSWFKRRSRESVDGLGVRVIEIPCVKLCPKGGVTAFTRSQLAQQPPRVCILRDEQDLKAVYREVKDVALPPENVTSK